MRMKIAGSAMLALLIVPGAVAPAAGEDPPARSFTIAAAGDILIHESIWQMADRHEPGYRTYDFTPMFLPVEPWISEADLAICHLEVPLSPDNSHISTYPRFSSPHELADAIAAVGYDTCSTASNHSLDQGVTGLRNTLDVLDEAGVMHTGTARTPEERLPALYEVQGVTVGHLSYTYGTNGLTSSVGYAVNSGLSRSAILADAAWARAHGAEFVIVSLHWGAEYVVRPLGSQESLARDLLESPDVDVILGHHVHVVQPIDRIGDEVVVYGMSNQLSNIRTLSDGSRSGAEDGVIVHLEVTERPSGGFRVTGVSYTPTWVHPTTKEILPVAHTLAGGTTIGSTLRRSMARTIDRINLLGVDDVGLSPTPWPPLTCRGRSATHYGTAGPDQIGGTSGDDVIAARGGSDTVIGRGGDDLICLGAGDDIASGGPGSDTLLGDSGDDRLRGNDGDDRLFGGEGRDLLAGGSGSDLLSGGPHPDEIAGNGGDDRLFGGPGDDSLDGGDGSDRLTGNHHDDDAAGGAGNDVVLGGPGRDLLSGGTGTDRLYGGSGIDLIRGNADDDTAYGGDHDDRIFGGDGADVLYGGPGPDQILGGPGHDFCRSAVFTGGCEW